MEERREEVERRGRAARPIPKSSSSTAMTDGKERQSRKERSKQNRASARLNHELQRGTDRFQHRRWGWRDEEHWKSAIPASHWDPQVTLGELIEAVCHVTHREQRGRQEGVWERERGLATPHRTIRGMNTVFANTTTTLLPV